MRSRLWTTPTVGCRALPASILVAVSALLLVSEARAARGAAEALVFESDLLEMRGTPVEGRFIFNFVFTNTAARAITVESVRTSCGCTVAEVPELPWTLEPGARGEFAVALDARGKRGTVRKSVVLNTTAGAKSLSVRAVIERAAGRTADSDSPLMDDRERNMEIALADRFAIFKGDCASCHAAPAKGKMGVTLYMAVCGICHDSPNRATMVPDLRTLPHPADRDHWLRWISFGRHGSLMPAFAESEGGPLSEAQIDSLADYLTGAIRWREPRREARAE
jgi:mono/diheme cytochrome c family protein